MSTTWSTAKAGTSTPSSVSFYDNPLLSDVTIKFGDHKISAHKFILSQKSKYFYTAFTGNFLVGSPSTHTNGFLIPSLQEANANVIDLGHDDEPACVYSLIKHIYDMSSVYDIDDEHDLLHLTQLFIVADKYDTPSLRTLVVEDVLCLMAGMDFAGLQIYPYVMAIQTIYDHVGDDSLKLETTQWFREQLESFSSNDNIKEVVGACGVLALELLKGLSAAKDDPILASMLKKELFCKMICDDPTLGRDLVCQTLARAKGSAAIYECKYCGSVMGDSYCYRCRRPASGPGTYVCPRIGYFVREAKMT